MKQLKYALFLSLIIPVLAEIILRLAGVMNVYSENIGLGYISPYSAPKTWYHRWPTTYAISHSNADFNYPYSINKNGLRDKDYDEAKSDSTIRILVTGDSFAEGVGAPYDSTWPRLLEKYLRNKNIDAEVIDAGESGSDIIYDYVFYRDILKNYHPDLVIASMNTSDYTDYYFRGGMERFHADGTTHFRKPPFIEYLYHYSHLFRAVYAATGHPIQGIYMTEQDYARSLNKANQVFARVIKDYQDEANKNNAQFLFLLHTSPSEIITRGGINDSTTNNFALLGTMVKMQDIPCIDVTGGLNNELSNKPWQYYTYRHDKHYKPTGYAVMAKLVCDSLLANGIIKY